MKWGEEMLKRILILLFIFILCPMHFALADCKNLAIKFANDPESMNVDELAELRKCVNDKLKEKFNLGQRTGNVPSSPIPSITPGPGKSRTTHTVPAPAPMPKLID
jgi:hypothetical protein